MSSLIHHQPEQQQRALSKKRARSPNTATPIDGEEDVDDAHSSPTQAAGTDSKKDSQKSAEKQKVRLSRVCAALQSVAARTGRKSKVTCNETHDMLCLGCFVSCFAVLALLVLNTMLNQRAIEVRRHAYVSKEHSLSTACGRGGADSDSGSGSGSDSDMEVSTTAEWIT